MKVSSQRRRRTRIVTVLTVCVLVAIASVVVNDRGARPLKIAEMFFDAVRLRAIDASISLLDSRSREMIPVSYWKQFKSGRSISFVPKAQPLDPLMFQQFRFRIYVRMDEGWKDSGIDFEAGPNSISVARVDPSLMEEPSQDDKRPMCVTPGGPVLVGF